MHIDFTDSTYDLLILLMIYLWFTYSTYVLLMIYLSKQWVTYTTYDSLMIYLFYLWFSYSTYNLLMIYLPISAFTYPTYESLSLLTTVVCRGWFWVRFCAFYWQKQQATGHSRQGLVGYGPTAIAAWQKTASSHPRPLPACFSAQALSGTALVRVAWTSVCSHSWNLPQAVPERQECCVRQQGQHAWTSTRLQGCQPCPWRTCTAWHLQMAGSRNSCAK